MEGPLAPIPERSTSLRAASKSAMDSLKALDPNRPIREADIGPPSALRPQPIRNPAGDLCRRLIGNREHRTDVDLAKHVAVGAVGAL
jgi:hypothetical protein